ncbi:sugar kinase [Paracoccus aurantiacus]|uniref:Sugar kinase n=1 Tax=Paracoccus aurantiacus TaxID=2599412 RepID=A0A5C6S6V1_9RHOB|nr:sugar kinase [Paracoccus aurantiacus]TXB69364.1 sugar kinase [Paracoccus aurantiacus]
MTRVVAIGECMVEFSATARQGHYQLGFAGDTLNTAWYLRRLLGPSDQVDYVTGVGTDNISDQMLAFLESAGIGTTHIQRMADRTVGLYMIQLDEGERSFAYWRGESAARAMMQDSDRLREALTGAQIAYLSGITIAILPQADREILARILGDFRQSGGQVVFDPNLRPRLWQSPAQMTAAVMAIAGVADTVLPSYEDEAAWFGDSDPAETARRYLGVGAQSVVVKNGPGDILAVANGEEIVIPIRPSTNVVDTTAAGDSFNAGFLAALLDGQQTRDAVLAGADLSARVIGQYGALVDIGQ